MGIGVALWLAGFIPSRAELAREVARADRAEAQRDALSEKVLGDVVPLLGDVSRNMLPAVERLTEEVRRMADKIQGTR